MAIKELASNNGYSLDEIENTLEGKIGRGGPTSDDPLGFDHNYVLNEYDDNNINIRKIAELWHP
jgi:hypothetical protein